MNRVSFPLKNDKATSSSKRHQSSVDGEPYNSSGPTFTPGIVHAHDEVTKRQWLLLRDVLHDLRISR